MKLYRFSNLSDRQNWARNPEHFRELEGLPGNALAVRIDHKGIEPLPGYHKLSDEGANTPIVTTVPPVAKKGRKYQSVSLTDLGQNPV